MISLASQKKPLSHVLESNQICRFSSFKNNCIYNLFYDFRASQLVLSVRKKRLEKLINQSNVALAFHFKEHADASENNSIWWPGSTIKLSDDQEEIHIYIYPDWTPLVVEEDANSKKVISLIVLGSDFTRIGSTEVSIDCNGKSFNFISNGDLSECTICVNELEFTILRDTISSQALISELRSLTSFHAKWSTSYDKLLEEKVKRISESFPIPPVENRMRVASHVAKNDVDGKEFIANGYTKYELIKLIYGKYSCKEIQESNVLDWGCGCGSVARYMIPSSKYFCGIDVDLKNVQWCQENLDSNSDFHAINFFDNLNIIEDNSFDLIYGFSVMTHLIPEHQNYWANLLSKKLRGLLLLTVHGPTYQCCYNANPIEAITLLSQMKNTRSPSPNLDIADIDKEGIYTDVANSFVDIVERWSRYVDIIAVLNNGHDWIVCKPKSV